MLFNSLQYAIFVSIALLGYWRLPRRGRQIFLVFASYVFYAWWDWRFLALIWLSTAVDHQVALALGRTHDERARRLLLAISVTVNVGILATFKYLGFFISSALPVVESLGLPTSELTLSIVLPVGISFYTFQTLGYSIDVFRRQQEPVRDPVAFALYVAFFPQLVAGPIERARTLLPQLQELPLRPDRDQIARGFELIILGLFKKVAIADPLARVTDLAHSDVGGASSLLLVVGMVAFTLQIYADFSGYTDLARGSARLFGIELRRNFHQPYLTRNITVFWRCWHMSLSSWFRDYVYIPLGGNRRGRARTYVNLIGTMVLVGLWHGAAWTFILFGLAQGLLMAIHRAVGRSATELPGTPSWRDVPAMAATTGFFGLTLVIFRSPTIAHAGEYLARMFAFVPGRLPTVDHLALVAFAGVVLLGIDLLQRARGREEIMLTMPAPRRGLAWGIAALAILVWSGGSAPPFYYFQF